MRTIRAQVPGTSSRHWLRRSARFTRSLWPHSAKAMSARTVRGRHQGPLLVLREQNSPFRIVIYEKGLEQIAKGIPDDPTRVRLEVRIRPSSKSKEFVGSSGLMPIDLFGMSRWGLEVAKRLGVAELKRMAIGSVCPTECEEVAQKIVKMFDRGMDRLLEQYGSPEEVGRILYEIQQKSRTAKQLKNSMQVETHGERAGVSGN